MESCKRVLYTLINALTAASLFFITGCTNSIPPAFNIENGGHLLVGLSVNNIPELQSFEIEIQKHGSYPQLTAYGVIRLCRMHGFTGCDRPDYESKDTLGVAFARRLPPGDYSIKTIRGIFYESGGGFGYLNFETAKDLNIPFRITAGKTSYLGRYHVESYVAKGVRYGTKRGTMVVTHSNQQSSDRQLAFQNMPLLYDHLEPFLPHPEVLRQIKNISTLRNLAKRNVRVLRAEKTTDGREYDGCVWWCGADSR